MKVAILGFGVEGQSAAAHWIKLGADITVCDQDVNKQLPDGFKPKLGPDWLGDLGSFDVIVRSPIIRPDDIAAANPGVDILPKVTSVVREFLAKCPAPIIGITGTKGKGTTTTLATKIIEASGRKAFIGGNIGIAPLDFLDEVTPDDVVVLELSSFQLLDATQSPHIAVCLMMVPEHLNWHVDFEEYAEAKGNIFRYQKPGDLAVYYGSNETSTRLAKLSKGQHIPYGETPGAFVRGDEIVMDDKVICKVSEVALPGPHNLQNICAAITATWELTKHNVEAVRNVVTTFSGLPHHLELVATIAGVGYYDDSFSTTPETAVAALKSFDVGKVAILGGSDKGIRFGELARAVEDENVIHALLIGEMGPVIAEALDEVGFAHYTVVKWQGIDNLIETASHLVESGDVVLLSPGCASFGLFKDYKDRSQQFQAAVTKLAKAHA